MKRKRGILWHLTINHYGYSWKKGLKKTDVIAMAGLTTNVMAQMGKDKPITFKNLERICKALSCTPNDIISFEDEFEKEI